MLNIVEKYSAEAAVENEDGVVAIEYVVVAAAIVAALAVIWDERSVRTCPPSSTQSSTASDSRSGGRATSPRSSLLS